jgi:hypothetical protein
MAKLGLDCKMYRNTGTYASPVWDEITNIRDVTLNLETGEADSSRRGGNGFRERLATLIDGGVDFEMVWETGDTDFTALRTAFFAKTPVEFAIMDGPVATAGTQGLRATMQVFNFSRNEPLGETVKASVSIKPTPATNPPAWWVIP